MNLHHLEIFNAIVQEGTISAGAGRMMISQPAASKQLKELEKSVGAMLLQRLPRGIRLTKAGELLAGYARTLFDLSEEAERAVRDLERLRNGQLRVGATPTLGTYLLPDVIVRLRKRFPQLRSSLEVENGDLLGERLAKGKLDLALAESLFDQDSFLSTEFTRDPWVVIAHPGHRLARRRHVTTEMLCEEMFIVRDTRAGESFVEREFVSRRLKLKSTFSLATTEAIKRAVAAGMGIAMVSKLAIDLEVQTKRLAVVRVADLNLVRPVYVHEMQKSRSKPAIAFLCLLKHAVRAMR